MLHPHTRLEWVGEQIGFGVVATKRIPMGTILWAQDPLDMRLTAKEARRLSSLLHPTLDRYSYTNAQGDRILCWDHARFMNHHCNPVSLSPGVSFELAVRDVEEGEEITCDYASLNLEEPFTCACGHASCRGTVSPEDFPIQVPLWDAALQRAVTRSVAVEQPLLPLLPQPERLAHWSECPDELPSSALHRYPAVQKIRAAV